ncbi:hypothetical protein QCE49_32640 [Caballeronia sp. LZ008]|uniref:hypothetical protein n=1 Tax=unclassified Caballeronia TaxID=2646786 RepID=UPI002027E422|nr:MULTISPECIES: hypothetical protein [unclassified Caballeronia]MDR5798148.1 hypothetical protein [Caballeronia sp. LZ008]
MSQQTTISTAMSEIVRVAWWSLRALGCPVGAVEAMARVLAYSEALDGQTLSALRRNEASLLAAFRGEQPRFLVRGEGRGVVDASGRSLLDVGPRAIDLITGLAKREGGPVRLTVQHLADTIGLRGTATVAAKRGVGLLVICGRLDPTWQFYAATRDGEVISIEGSLAGPSVDVLLNSIHEIAGPQFVTKTCSLELDDNYDRACPDAHIVELFAFPFVPIDEFPIRASRRTGVTCKHVSRALQHAYSHGVDVLAEDLRFLYELETRTWAPSSERSRMQAGFQMPAPTA